MRIKLDMAMQDPAYAPNWGRSSNVRFLLVGVGGTGGYLFYYLTRLLASLKDLPSQQHYNRYQLIIADGDLVEKKNLVRQNFVEPDIGKSKARVLSHRYGNVYNLSIPYHSDFIEDLGTLKDLLVGQKMGFTPRITFLLGAVDNNKTRQLFHQAFEELDSLVYIDSGNDEWTGQVIMGIKADNRTIIPPVGYFYPDILEDKDSLFPTESCEETVVSSPQNIATNIMAGTIMFNLINQMLTNGTEIYGATFSAKTSQIRPLWLEEIIDSSSLYPYPFSS